MSPADMRPIDWGAIILAALGLGTAIVRVVGRRRAAPKPNTEPSLPAIPSQVPPTPPGRTDAAITAAEHEKSREEAARRAKAPQPAPVADLTKPASQSSDDAIEPRDLQ